MSTQPHFLKLDATGKLTAGHHVAVYDRRTTLIWTADPLQSGKTLIQPDAMAAASKLRLLGRTDWRGPTIEELLSIIDYTRFDPAVDTEYFRGPFGWTWASTIVASAPASDVWNVYLGSGLSARSRTDDRDFARAVRAGQDFYFLAEAA